MNTIKFSSKISWSTLRISRTRYVNIIIVSALVGLARMSVCHVCHALYGE